MIDLTASPVCPPQGADAATKPIAKQTPPPPVLKRRYDKLTPEKTPVRDKGKGKAKAPVSAGMTLVVKGLGTRGTLQIPEGCSLTDAIAMVQQRVGEVMGRDAQEVAGLLVQAGSVDEAVWSGRPVGGRMSVALVWAWSS